MSTAFADSGQSAIEPAACAQAAPDHAAGHAILDRSSGQAPSAEEAVGQATVPANLSQMTVDELLELSSRSYRQLDRKHPVRDALVQYYAIARELETRETLG